MPTGCLVKQPVGTVKNYILFLKNMVKILKFYLANVRNIGYYSGGVCAAQEKGSVLPGRLVGRYVPIRSVLAKGLVRLYGLMNISKPPDNHYSSTT